MKYTIVDGTAKTHHLLIITRSHIMAYIKTYDPREWVEFTDKEGNTVYARRGEIAALMLLSDPTTLRWRKELLISLAVGRSHIVVGAKQINKVLRALKFNRVPKKYGHRMTEEYGRSPKSGRRK